LGIYDTIRLSAADAGYRANTTESLQKAVHLEPGNADYHELLADHLESDGKDSLSDRAGAARLSPFESRYWIGLGVKAEIDGNLAAAERDYLHAANTDRMFVPRWTLMNFYFRRQDARNFWPWAKRAFEMAYGDSYALFRLCWLMTDDPQTVASVLPFNPDIRRSYLNFLIDTERFQYLSPFDREASEHAAPTEVPSMINMCERAMLPNPRAALDMWNALCRKGLEPYSPLDPDKGQVVTNGSFSSQPIERAFDWRASAVDGVQVNAGAAGGGISVQLTGNQPEDCVILLQFVPLASNRMYRMEYEYSSPAALDASGLTWELADPITNTVTASSPSLKLTGAALTDRFEFTPAASGVAKLILRYARESGTVRRAEAVVLKNVSIQAQPGGTQ
jgi:hypothetical protein